MGQISISGALEGGPPAGAETFPASKFLTPLSLRESAKQFGVATGVLTRNLQVAAPAFATLDGVGPAATVTQGDFLYFKCDGQLVLRLTTDDGGGGQDVQTVPVHGLAVLEFPTTRPLELLEAQGTGKIEYLVSGPI